MLPEILNVAVEGGGDVQVPLTPVTTFRDVSACVRDPGDPLPLVLEESPLGARVVAGWERPLELLRLWGGLREQVTYNASFSLSRHLREEYYVKPVPRVRRSRTPNSFQYDKIDPWELYELRDELKDLQDVVSGGGGSGESASDGWDSLLEDSKDFRGDINTEGDSSYSSCDKENDLNRTNTDDSHTLWTSFNSHTKDKRYSKKNRTSMSEENKSKHLKNLLEESKLALYGSPFKRGSTQMCSYPTRNRTGPPHPQHNNYRFLYEKHNSNDKTNNNLNQTTRRVDFHPVTNHRSIHFQKNRSNMVKDFDFSTSFKETTINEENRRNPDLKPRLSTNLNEMEGTSNNNSRNPFTNILLRDTYRNTMSSKPKCQDEINANNFKRHIKHPCVSPDSHVNVFNYEFGNYQPPSSFLEPSKQQQLPSQNKLSPRNQDLPPKQNRQYRISPSLVPRQQPPPPTGVPTKKTDANIMNGFNVRPGNRTFQDSLENKSDQKIQNKLSHNQRNFQLDKQSQSSRIDKSELLARQKQLQKLNPSPFNHTCNTSVKTILKNINTINQTRPQYKLGSSQLYSDSTATSTNSSSSTSSSAISSRDEQPSELKKKQFALLLRQPFPSKGSTGKYAENEIEIPAAHSRRSRAQKRVNEVDHRRSYSDPVYEYLNESLEKFGTRRRRRRHSGGGNLASDEEGMKDSQPHLQLVPSGGEVTVGELREMATRQQRQIESQQQLLVAKEQRLKYLKQQEGRAPQVTLEAERLRRLRERVEAQEAKLKRLRALRGQVDTSRLNAASLSSDLDAMRHLFSEKEKELVDAAAKVEELTRQLEEVRSGRTLGGGGAPPNPLHIHQQELEKLRRELLYRNSVNREAVARVASQRDALTSRKDEIARIDKRIAELQQRLHRKRVLNQQLASQISAATQAKQAQLKAVQQKAFREGNKDNSADDVTCEKIRTMEDLAQFERGKHDPKYQTLPYNTKFSSAVKGRNGSGCFDPDLHQAPSHLPPAPNEHPSSASLHGINSTSGTSHNGNMSAANNNVGVVTRTVHSIPTHLPSRGHASAPGVTSSSNSSLGSTSASTTSYNSSSTSSSTTMTRNQLNNQTNNHSANKPISSTQNYSPKNLTEEPTKQILPNANNNNNNQNSSSNQDLRANLPPTSLSVSFTQKLSPGVGAHVSTRSAVQPVNKDVENVRALGYPSGSASFTNTTKTTNANGTPSSSSTEEDIADTSNDRKMKPILPPKPAVPSKPTPPPRQKGDPMAGSNESLNFSGVSHRSNGQTRPQVFRYASQNVIMSTYTQHQQQQQQHQLQQPSVSDIQSQLLSRESPPKSTNSMAPSSQPESSISNTESEAKEAIGIAPSAIAKENTNKDVPSVDRSPEKVHISINRRIEMPPDFLFPEGATPPSDLLGRQLEEMVKVVSKNDTASKSSNETPEKININSSVTNNNNNNNNTNNNTSNNNNHMPNINTGSINLNTIHANVNATLNDIERLRIGSTDKEDRFNHELQGLNNVTSCSNITIEDLADKDSSEDINDKDNDTTDDIHHLAPPSNNSIVVRRLKKGNLKTTNSSRAPRRVSFDPLALLLDASLEGELELVKRTATEVPNPSAANDEGITALHNAICAGHLDIVTFLVTFGCDVNAQDSDGWTPLHCAASCNNVAMVRFLVEHGACVLATTLSDHETAAEKCEQDEEGYDGCSQYLYSIQEKLGIMNGGSVYGVFDYDASNEDELCFKCGDAITIIRRGDEYEREWWWARLSEKCGYIPRNLLGLYPRVKNPFKNS